MWIAGEELGVRQQLAQECRLRRLPRMHLRRVSEELSCARDQGLLTFGRQSAARRAAACAGTLPAPPAVCTCGGVRERLAQRMSRP